MSSATRASVSLDGLWSLHLPETGGTRTVSVPGPWTTQVPGHGDSHATVRYERTFAWQGVGRPDRAQVVRFGAVNHRARVTVNGIEVGEHTGAWLPFECDVTAALRDGDNRIEVEVSYPPRFGDRDEPGFLERPLGKQSWYGTTAGIWQSVTLEDRHRVQVGAVRVLPDATTGDIAVEATVGGSPQRVFAVVSEAGRALDRVELLQTDGADRFSGRLHVQDARRWGLDAPHLYDVEILAQDGDEILDAVSRTTGFREFTAENGVFRLNGEELYLRAVLDQDYHPGSSSHTDDLAGWEQLLRETRALGFNMLRVHIKRPDPRYFDIADRLGILVWAELPSWMTWTPEVAEEGRRLLKAMIAEDGHHPSIVVWTIMNESWGIDLASATQRAWLRGLFDEISAEARGALVVDNSACEPNFHLRTDIDDFHVYRGIPESRREWDAKIAEFAGRPDWTFSPHGDAERQGDEPLVLSEFGNWALPRTVDRDDAGAEPWWFRLGACWAFGAAEGTGLMERFVELGLADVFGSWDELVSQLQRAQLIANRYQVTSIRLHGEVSGYVLTQLSDVQWEANGLFDMNRRPKQYTSEFALANGDHAIALRPTDYSVYAGGETTVTVTPLPAPSGFPSPTQLRLTLDGECLAAETVVGRDTTQFTVPMPGEPGQYALVAELVVDGVVAARDSADLVVVARAPWTGMPALAADAEVGAWLTELAIPWSPQDPAAAGSSGSSPLVTRRFTEDARRFARAGGHVLLLAEDADALGDAFDFLPSARLVSRAGDGDWVPRTEWLDRRGAFAEVPGDTMLGIAFEDLLGPLVISGIPNPLRPAIVHSGIFSGWLRGAASSTVTVRWSQGAVTITTLRARAALSAAPVAHAVGRALVAAASAPAGE